MTKNVFELRKDMFANLYKNPCDWCKIPESASKQSTLDAIYIKDWDGEKRFFVCRDCYEAWEKEQEKK
jgi:hypothetical protein